MTILEREEEDRSGETMTIQAYKRIRQDILSGVLAPNQKLKIDDLKRRSGFGASPIREALALLISDGLTVRMDARGFRVAGISIKAYEDLHRMRCHLEVMALRESIANGDKNWEENIVLTHYWLHRGLRKPLENTPTAGDADWEVRHKAFHMSLLSACESKILLNVCSQLFDENIRYRNISHSVSGFSRCYSNEHSEIFEAASKKDEDLAVERLVNHYSRTADLVRSFLSEANDFEQKDDQSN